MESVARAGTRPAPTGTLRGEVRAALPLPEIGTGVDNGLVASGGIREFAQYRDALAIFQRLFHLPVYVRIPVEGLGSIRWVRRACGADLTARRVAIWLPPIFHSLGDCGGQTSRSPSYRTLRPEDAGFSPVNLAYSQISRI